MLRFCDDFENTCIYTFYNILHDIVHIILGKEFFKFHTARSNNPCVFPSFHFISFHFYFSLALWEFHTRCFYNFHPFPQLLPEPPLFLYTHLHVLSHFPSLSLSCSLSLRNSKTLLYSCICDLLLEHGHSKRTYTLRKN